MGKKSICMFAALALMAALAPLTASGPGASGSGERPPNQLAYFVGKVTQGFTQDGPSRLASEDIDGYVDLDAKVIRSVTGELEWDYGGGVVTVDTPMSQGATGFLKAYGAVETADLLISSGNGYVSILAISLDGKALAESGKVLVQAMTDEKNKGWSTIEGFILDLGGFPLLVRKVDAEVAFKGRPAPSRVVALDENGYELGDPLPFEAFGGGFTVRLPEAAIYTVIEFG